METRFKRVVRVRDRNKKLITKCLFEIFFLNFSHAAKRERLKILLLGNRNSSERGAHRSSRCIETLKCPFFYCFWPGFALLYILFWAWICSLYTDFGSRFCIFTSLYIYFTVPFLLCPSLYCTLPILYHPLYRLLYSGFFGIFWLSNAFFFRIPRPQK